MSTPHISAEMGDFAKTVLMPGDPLRAKFIADTFLQDVRQVTGVRGMLGFTGTYEGRPISVMGSGMGMPSIGIYSYELFNFYGVENIVRIGSAGSYTEKAKLFDTVLATGAVSESNYARVQSGNDHDITFPSETLNDKLRASAKKQGIYEFFKFYNNHDNQVKWSLGSAYPPNNAAVKESELSERPLIAKLSQYTDKSYIGIAGLKGGFGDILASLNTVATNTVRTDDDIQSLLDQAETEIQGYLDEYSAD